MRNENWNEINFLLSENVNSNISESEFEKNVIQALRVLEWKEFLGDFQIRPSFPIGASNRITPDFVINSKEKKNLFVIEIKQPSIPINTKFQQQLFSYMRQLKLQYGILIGEVIQIFYDGDLTEHDDPVLLETINFNVNNEKGNKFVELFSKATFNLDTLKSFTINSLRKINRKNEQKKIKERIVSDDFQSQILELIKQDLLNEYDAESIENALKEISIKVSPKLTHETVQQKTISLEKNETININGRDKTKYILNKSGIKLAKNRFVLESVKKYIENNPTNFSTLKNIFKDEYQGSTGVINELKLVETKYANKSNKRHFTANNEILKSNDNIEFVVSTEWGKDNINNIVNLMREKGFDVQEI